MARVDHGTVEIKLGSKSVSVQPTLKGMIAINRQFGDFRTVITKLEAMDVEAVVFVLKTALDKKDGVEEDIFNAGILNVIPDAINYIMALMNPSGRKSAAGDEEDDSKKV